MNKSLFLIGLVFLLPLFAFAVQMNGVQANNVILFKQAVVLEVIWLGLTYFGWLGTRWHRGHWDVNALSATSDRRRFLLVGLLMGALLSVWGGYLGILDRVIW